MLQYRLLRNNKESGPYSKEQLIALGLKAYDLIWADSKSAAWSYPSEMEEFKFYAPAVEEQPFDRFFKKENKTKTNIIEARNIQQPIEQQNFSSSIIKKEKPRIKVKADWRKVEMPIAEEKKETLNVPPQNSFVTSSPQVSWQDAWINWEQEKNAVKSASANEKKLNKISSQNVINDVEVETKFSQSLDDIKERYVETVLKPRQKKSFSVKKYILPAILFPLLGFGMWVGFTQQAPNSNNADASKKQQAIQPQQSVIIPPTVDENNNTSPDDNLSPNNQVSNNDAANNQSETPINEQESEANDANKSNKIIAENKVPEKNIFSPSIKNNQNIVSANKPVASVSAPSKQNVAPVKTDVNKDLANNNTQNIPAVTEPPVHANTTSQYGQTVRSAVRRGDNNLPDNSAKENSNQNTPPQNSAVNNSDKLPKAVLAPPATKKRIEDFVQVNNGAQNMHLSVQNVADFALDLAVLDIQYFDGAGRFQKGETVYVKNLPASETVDIKVPASKNTARIRYKVSLVSAEKKNLYMIAD